MPESNKTRLLWDAVKKETDALKAIRMTAEIGEEAILASEVDRVSIKSQLADLRKILSGNGDPSHSIINRVEKIDADTLYCRCKIDNIEDMLIGDVEKGTTGESLLDKVKRSERIADNATKLFWAILIAVIIEIVLQVMQII